MMSAIIILVALGLLDLMLFIACFELEKEREIDMSWYSDKERFNEYDDPYCVWKSMANGGKCGNSKEECDRCMRDKERMEEESDDNA